ncbi:MAG: hypothetical protein JWO67_6470 [Streptosporangiaceae bacterium]|nr:hypothetical protein [Streptosporangiaceae bacterium]
MSEEGRSLESIGASLIASVDGLRIAVASLVARAEKSERRIAGIVFAVVLDLIFTGCFAGLYWQQSKTSVELADTRIQVLCPMYATFLGAYNPNSRAPGTDRQTYEGVFAQLRGSYEHLQCTTPLVPRPTPPPPGN